MLNYLDIAKDCRDHVFQAARVNLFCSTPHKGNSGVIQISILQHIRTLMSIQLLGKQIQRISHFKSNELS